MHLSYVQLKRRPCPPLMWMDALACENPIDTRMKRSLDAASHETMASFKEQKMRQMAFRRGLRLQKARERTDKRPASEHINWSTRSRVPLFSVIPAPKISARHWSKSKIFSKVKMGDLWRDSTWRHQPGLRKFQLHNLG